MSDMNKAMELIRQRRDEAKANAKKAQDISEEKYWAGRHSGLNYALSMVEEVIKRDED